MMEMVWMSFCRRHPTTSGPARRSCFLTSVTTSPPWFSMAARTWQ
uniref:Uncharacterized protein n=1 Tax=Arundo donax TaxID=35708 RepID=A0A0A8ZNL7_ARUDO